MVSALYQLTSQRVDSTGLMPGGVFLRRPHVEQIHGTIICIEPCVDLAASYDWELFVLHQVANPPLYAGEVGCRDRLWKAEACVVVEFETCETPPLRAVQQRNHPSGNTEIDEGLRANDTARTPRAIYNNCRSFLRHTGGAQAQLGVRTGDASWNAHALMFGGRASVEDDGWYV